MAINLIFSQESLADVESAQTTTRNECRICLMEVVGEHHDLCACRGHLRNIHMGCLLEWIRRTITFQEVADGMKKCQICRAEIELDVVSSYQCTNLRQIIDQNNQNKQSELDTKSAILLCIFIGAFITMVIASAIYLQNQQKKQVTLYLIISLAFVSFFALLLFIKCFFMKEKYRLIGIKFKESKFHGLRKGKVRPLHSDCFPS